MHSNQRRLFALVPLLILVWGSLAGVSPAGAAEIKVNPGGDIAEIGKNLVLTVDIIPGPGETLKGEGLVISVSTGEAQAFFGAPYPLRVLPGSGTLPAEIRDPIRVEWAAPVGLDVEPVDANLRVDLKATSAAGEPVTAEWTGNLRVDFGEGWNENKVSNLLKERGLPFFLIMVFGFGLLMSLSPCIYPMIPITLAVIGAQSQEKGVARGFVLSVTYVLGMALVYAIIGLVVATVFSGLIAFMQSPWVVGPIAALLVVMAFGMFGAFELQAPQALRDKLQGPGGGNRSGLLGTFVIGMVAGLVASPCVGPFLNALLLVIATTGDWLVGFLSLFVFGLGMGLLLIGVGTFPALMGKLPQSGGWMESVKKGMGLLLVAMAFWFVRPSIFLPENIFYPLLGGSTILIGVFFGAFDSLAPGAHWWEKTRKGLGIIALAVGLYMLVGTFINLGMLLPEHGTVKTVEPLAQISPQDVTRTAVAVETAPLPDKVPWTIIKTGENVNAFLAEKRAAAKAAGQPVMIDFWATWCVYCKKLDKTVWNNPDVVAESQRFMTIKVDATAPDDPEMVGIKEELRVSGLPLVVFIDSRGEILHGQSSGFKPAEDMLAVMKSIR
jgi:thiol:disulfide interchange protein DsbD